MDGNEQLFDTGADKRENASAKLPANAPLAAKMRPDSLENFVGQRHLLKPGSALRRALEERPHSMLLYGPPGSGKTTLARLVAKTGRAAFEELSAVSAGRPEVRKVIEVARQRLAATSQTTVLFLDEIHRFNKAQQDALLPAVEEGVLVLVGATTENPYFEINSALLSRMQIYELEPLSESDLVGLLKRAVEQGFEQPPTLAEGVAEFLAARAGGDARAALSALEVAVEIASEKTVELTHAEDALQRKAVLYDRDGDHHYDYISAWIKATRASNVDASLYYLAVMLEGGEDPRFIARRMVIFASEDIGCAAPQALQVATATAAAVEHVGLPECQFSLAQAAIYLSLAPKSNSAKEAIGAARRHVREHGAKPPPNYLRSASYPGAKKLGRGGGYDYPHNHPGHVGPQETAPEELVGERFYSPADTETEMAKRAERIERIRRELSER